jgi:hypothetical protein
MHSALGTPTARHFTSTPPQQRTTPASSHGAAFPQATPAGKSLKLALLTLATASSPASCGTLATDLGHLPRAFATEAKLPLRAVGAEAAHALPLSLASSGNEGTAIAAAAASPAVAVALPAAAQRAVEDGE